MNTKFTNILLVLLSLCLLIALAGCGTAPDETVDDGVRDTTAPTENATEPEETTEPEPVYETRTVYLCTREYLQNYEGGNFLKGYTYDEYGRVTEYFQIQDDGSRGWVMEYSYDEKGNNVEIRNGSGVTRMTYDEENRLLSEIHYYKEECNSETYYEYDAQGYVVAETRIERYSEEVTYTFSIAYNENHTEAEIAQYKNGEPNGTTFEEYNAAGQVLTSSVYDADGNWKSTLTCSYDDAGNLLQEGSYTRSETQADYMTYYTYDENGLLISKNVDYYYGYLLEYTYEPFEILVRVN